MMRNMTTKATRSSDTSSREKNPSSDHIEAEWQFEAEDLAVVEEWLKLHDSGPDVFVEPAGVRDVRDTYLDTEDWRFHRAGYALRVRESDGDFEATMKSLSKSRGDDGAWRRREISEHLKNAESLGRKVTGLINGRIRAITGGPKHPEHAPRPLFEVRTQRTVYEIRLAVLQDANNGETVVDASGSIRSPMPEESAVRVGEVVLDATSILLVDEDEPTLQLRRVEIETTEDSSAALKSFVDSMRDALKLRPAFESKYEAGIEHAGLTPTLAPDFGPTSVKRSSTAGDLAFAVLREQFAEMLRHEPGVRLGEDPENLHDMRVATRRMRAAMKLFRDALPERCQWFRDELKAFAKVLGDVRDIDVLIQDQERQTAEADEERCDSLENITKWLEKERDAARKTLLETLDSERYERFQEYFAAMLRDGTDGEGYASKSAAALGRNVISTARDKCLKTSKRLGEDSPPEAYHDLRKRGKQLRYALEFLSSVYGVKKSAKLVKPLKEAQDTLGDQQDSIVATKLLRSLAEGSRRINRATVFEMGASSGRQAQEANEARLNFMQSGGFETFLKGSTWKDFDKDMRNTIKKARK